MKKKHSAKQLNEYVYKTSFGYKRGNGFYIPVATTPAKRSEAEQKLVDRHVYEFMSYVNSDPEIRKIKWGTIDVASEQFRKMFRDEAIDNFNALVTVETGVDPNRFLTDEEIAEQKKIAADKFAALEKRLNRILPNNPYFRNIEARIVNKDINITIINGFTRRKPRFEKWDDKLYGAYGYIKFGYKR